MDKTMILKPRLSEKTYGLSQGRVYVFDVPRSANKQSVARAVQSQFEVTVLNVNIANSKGETRRRYAKGGRVVLRGKESDRKKAYVTLAEGQSLPLFEAVEANTKDTAAKNDKEKK